MKSCSADPADHVCVKGRMTMNKCRITCLRTIVTAELAKTEHLYARDNLLSSVGEELGAASKLKQLDLSQNEICSLDCFPELCSLRCECGCIV